MVHFDEAKRTYSYITVRFVRYLRKLAEMKRKEPADDLVSALVVGGTP
jgi:cytochrome P450